MSQSKISLGTYLKQQREAKGLSIDEVAIETNIAKKYIEALENDEYVFFPAEMYVTGFLTAYVEVLEMDKELVLSMYHRSVAKEQEAPLEEVYSLYSSENKIKKHLTTLTIALPLILILTIMILFFRNNSNQNTNDVNQNVGKVQKTTKEISLELSQINNTNNTFLFPVNSTVLLMKDGELKNTLTFLGIQDRQIRFQLGYDIYTHKVNDILSASLLGDGDNNLGIEIISLNNKEVGLVLTLKKALVVSDNTFSIETYRASIRSENPVAIISNSSQLNMNISAQGIVWLSVQSDDQETSTIVLASGQSTNVSFQGYSKVLLGNAGRATISFNQITNVLRGGVQGEASYSIFYTRPNGGSTQLIRALLR